MGEIKYSANSFNFQVLVRHKLGGERWWEGEAVGEGGRKEREGLEVGKGGGWLREKGRKGRGKV